MIEVSATKLGGVWYAAATNEKGKLVAVSLTPRSRDEAIRSVTTSIRKAARGKVVICNRAQPIIRTLHTLYLGKRSSRYPVIDVANASALRRRIYSIVRRVPRGRVATYGSIAKAVGSRGYARAVGAAMASNPLPLLIPCHRVVPSTLEVGQYGLGGKPSRLGTRVKRELLAREGVRFDGDRVSRTSVWKPR